MPHIIELINHKKHSTDYMHRLWQQQGIRHTLISTATHTPAQDYEVRIRLIRMHGSPEDTAPILRQHFYIPTCISKIPILAKNITRLPRLYINSCILQKSIKKIEKKYGRANAIILHEAYGTETPYFVDGDKTFFYLHSTISNTWVWAKPRNRKRTRNMFSNKNIMCCGYNSMQDFKTLNIPYKSLGYATNGVPVHALRQDAQHPLPAAYTNTPYITTVCRLSPEKQVPQMIQAFVNANLNCQFIIVGEGDERPKIEQKIKALQCQDKVILYGFDKNPSRWLKNAMFSVVFSTYEGAPHAVPESLCLGTPVIISDRVTQEYFDTTLMPYVIPHQDINALTTAMQRMYKNPVKISPELQNKHDLKYQIAQVQHILEQQGCL